MTTPISTVFLRDVSHGGPAGQLATVAEDLAAFVSAATTSVDLAIYDFRLDDAHATSTVVGALTAAADRGVAVRIGFDAGKPSNADTLTFAALGADPAPLGTADWVDEHFRGTTVQTKPIQAGGQIMHSKYVLRDAVPAAAHRPHASSTAAGGATTAVWTGSTNFTDDAWTRQENNIITLASPAMATSYRTDFDEMWTSGSISGAGKGDAGTATLDGATLGWDFCPGDGAAVNAALARRVSRATERLIVASMVLTSHEVLAALSAAIDRKVPLSGVYDGGQMDPIVEQWKKGGHSAAVLADWAKVSAHLAHKQSAPYSPTGVHDFMHLKVLVSDDVVTTGSYNFSANAERNAENQLHLNAPDVVADYVTFLDTLVTTYS